MTLLSLEQALGFHNRICHGNNNDIVPGFQHVLATRNVGQVAPDDGR